jgi:hypothetical protein
MTGLCVRRTWFAGAHRVLRLSSRVRQHSSSGVICECYDRAVWLPHRQWKLLVGVQRLSNLLRYSINPAHDFRDHISPRVRQWHWPGHIRAADFT